MLVIEPKSTSPRKVGSGLFDIARNLINKTANSTLARKVINSATTKNLQRAVDSEIGKEIKRSVLTGVSKGSESATQSVFEKLGIAPPPSQTRKRKKTTKKKTKKVTKSKKAKGVGGDGVVGVGEGIVLD